MRMQSIPFAALSYSLLVGLGALAPTALAQTTPADACTAHWEGAITLPTGPLVFDVDLRRAASGACAGDISIPAQGARDVALLNVLATTDSLRFTISGVPGNPTFGAARTPIRAMARSTSLWSAIRYA